MPGMKLSDYLSAAGQNATDFAAKIKCEPSTITRILKGQRGASVPLALKIEKATGGKVQPCDLLRPNATETAA